MGSRFMDGFSQRPTQSISTRCRDQLGLVDFVRKESRFVSWVH